MAAEDKHKNKYSIKILGEELVVVGDISDEYVQKLATHINSVGKEITRAYPRLPRQRVLGLAIVNIADEYFKLKKKYLKHKKEIDILQKENNKLKEELSKLKEDYQDLLGLLEEVE